MCLVWVLEYIWMIYDGLRMEKYGDICKGMYVYSGIMVNIRL